jgi:hypothetical protein
VIRGETEHDKLEREFEENEMEDEMDKIEQGHNIKEPENQTKPIHSYLE